MGGYGSGGGRGARRENAFWKLSIADLKRFGALKKGNRSTLSWSSHGETRSRIGIETYDDHIVLDYKTTAWGDWTTVRETVPLAHTYPHFGGARVWFLCPCCHGRCSVLWGDGRYLCRSCQRMTYTSQYQNHDDRQIDQALERRVKLGGRKYDSMDMPFPPKPKRMRWKTYDALEAKDDLAEKRYERLMHGYYKILEGLRGSGASSVLPNSGGDFEKIS